MGVRRGGGGGGVYHHHVFVVFLCIYPIPLYEIHLFLYGGHYFNDGTRLFQDKVRHLHMIH